MLLHMQQCSVIPKQQFLHPNEKFQNIHEESLQLSPLEISSFTKPLQLIVGLLLKSILILRLLLYECTYAMISVNFYQLISIFFTMSSLHGFFAMVFYSSYEDNNNNITLLR